MSSGNQKMFWVIALWWFVNKALCCVTRLNRCCLLASSYNLADMFQLKDPIKYQNKGREGKMSWIFTIVTWVFARSLRLREFGLFSSFENKATKSLVSIYQRVISNRLPVSRIVNFSEESTQVGCIGQPSKRGGGVKGGANAGSNSFFKA